MRKTVFIKNAAILTISSLILRFAGIILKVWLGAEIGAEGIGLYQLIFSVYVFASTFTSSGISTAVTRLATDELALGSKSGVLRIVRRCIQITLILAAVTVALILFGANFIAKTILEDARAALSIKILSVSLPFMGISSCFRGYFIARRKAGPASSAQLFEQVVRIVIIMLLVRRYAASGLEYACAAVLFGDTVAEIASCGYMYLRYLGDKRKLGGLKGRKRPPYGIVKAVNHIALPITAGRYLNSGLRTAENILVPKALALCAMSGDNALALFGMIKGMALPILFFPSTLLGALSTLLIPEMSEAATRGRRGVVRGAAHQIIKVTSLVGFIVAAVFLVAGRRLGALIYGSADVGFLLCALSPIVPLMYLDSVCDGILKGLDQQVFTFRNSIADSAIRIALVWLVLPRFGIYGFIGIMYFSNLLTCSLNVGRLIKCADVQLDITKTLFLPLLGALVISQGTNALLNIFGMSHLVYIILLCLMCIPIYLVYLVSLGILSKDDINAFR